MRIILELLKHLTPYGHLAHLIMFAILILCGFGLPLPEDIILVTGGILSSQGVIGFWTSVFVCLFGVLIGDGTIFFMGHKFGPRIKENRFFANIINTEREKKVASWFKKYGDKVIFFARFMPGLRMPLFLSAGIYHVPAWKFFALDGFAALISVPLWIWVGHVFGENLEALEVEVRKLQLGIYSVIGAILLLLLAVWFIKKRLKDYSQNS